MTRKVIFVPDDFWTNPPQENTAMDELDHARALVDDTITRARSGEGLDAIGLADRWQGSPIVLIGAALLAAVGTPDDPDPNPAPRDFRRAEQFLAGWATSDAAMFSPPVEEAEADGRSQHLLAAMANYAVLGLGLRHDPAQLAELRRSIAIWANQETTEEK
jgi:hypothetical protein